MGSNTIFYQAEIAPELNVSGGRITIRFLFGKQGERLKRRTRSSFELLIFYV
jgi:hypothetical protein